MTTIAVYTAAQAKELCLPGWNLCCNRCGTFGAEWLPSERPGWGSLALCPPHAEELRAEHERHRAALAELRAVRYEQPWGRVFAMKPAELATVEPLKVRAR